MIISFLLKKKVLQYRISTCKLEFLLTVIFGDVFLKQSKSTHLFFNKVNLLDMVGPSWLEKTNHEKRRIHDLMFCADSSNFSLPDF
jgi:hypothetical protein